MKVYLYILITIVSTVLLIGSTTNTSATKKKSFVKKTTANSNCGHYIGERFAGGIIFYLEKDSCHGLIAALVNQGSLVPWYNGPFTNSSKAFSNGIGNGLENTKGIILEQGLGLSYSYAAELCNAYENEIYHDWYLPSIDELNLMYTNIGPGAAAPNINIGNFAESYYWSSNEISKDSAMCQVFVTGLGWLKGLKKWDQLSIRAIRQF